MNFEDQSNLEIALSLKLIFDNALFLLPIICTLKIRDYPFSTILFLTMINSTIYHTCQTGVYCAYFDFHTFQSVDHISVYSCIFWTILFLTSLSLQIRISIWLLLTFTVLPFLMVEDNIYIGIIGFAFAAFIAIIVIYTYRKEKQTWYLSNIILILFCGLIGIPLYIYGGNIGDFDYTWSHGIWHDLAALGALFAVDIKEGSIINRITSKIYSKTIVITTYHDGKKYRIGFEKVSIKTEEDKKQKQKSKNSPKIDSSSNNSKRVTIQPEFKIDIGGERKKPFFASIKKKNKL